MPVGIYKRRTQPETPVERQAQDSRSVRQIEDYYEKRGYDDRAIESNAADDWRVIKRLQGRQTRRRPRSRI